MAAVIPSAVLSLFSLAIAPETVRVSWTETFFLLGVTMAMFFPASLALATALGLPALYLFRYLRIATWWVALGWGALAGAVLSVFIPLGSESYLVTLSAYLPTAGLSAVVFWAIWDRGARTNLDQ